MSTPLGKKITDAFKVITDVLSVLAKKYEEKNPDSTGAKLFDATITGLETAKTDIIKFFASGDVTSLSAVPAAAVSRHTSLMQTLAADDPPAPQTSWEDFLLEYWHSIEDAIELGKDFLDSDGSTGEKVAITVLDSFKAAGNKLFTDLGGK